MATVLPLIAAEGALFAGITGLLYNAASRSSDVRNARKRLYEGEYFAGRKVRVIDIGQSIKPGTTKMARVTKRGRRIRKFSRRNKKSVKRFRRKLRGRKRGRISKRGIRTIAIRTHSRKYHNWGVSTLATGYTPTWIVMSNLPSAAAIGTINCTALINLLEMFPRFGDPAAVGATQLATFSNAKNLRQSDRIFMEKISLRITFSNMTSQPGAPPTGYEGKIVLRWFIFWHPYLFISTSGNTGTVGAMYPLNTLVNGANEISPQWFLNNTENPFQLVMNKKMFFKVVKSGHVVLGPQVFNALPGAGDTNQENDTRVPADYVEFNIKLNMKRMFQFPSDEIATGGTIGTSDQTNTYGAASADAMPFNQNMRQGRKQLFFMAFITDPTNSSSVNPVGSLKIHGLNVWEDC